MKPPAFQFYPKQWLGDDKVLAMSWCARAMHMHLMCIAWQQEPPCTIPNDDDLIKRWLQNPKNWHSVKNEIFAAWILDGERWLQRGLLEIYERQKAYRDTRSANAKKRWIDNAHASPKSCINDALLFTSTTKDKNILPKSRAMEIYLLYPKKMARASALKAINKASQRLLKENADRDPWEYLIVKVSQFAKECRETRREKQFIPYPATWFNAEGYEDEALISEPRPYHRIEWPAQEVEP